MSRADWDALANLAASTGSLYSGAASWRRMILRIARGEITLRLRKRGTNTPVSGPAKPGSL